MKNITYFLSNKNSIYDYILRYSWIFCSSINVHLLYV